MPLTCSLRIGRLCGQPADKVLIVQDADGAAGAYPRCGEHDADGYKALIGRMYPGAVSVIVPLPGSVQDGADGAGPLACHCGSTRFAPLPGSRLSGGHRCVKCGAVYTMPGGLSSQAS